MADIGNDRRKSSQTQTLTLSVRKPLFMKVSSMTNGSFTLAIFSSEWFFGFISDISWHIHIGYFPSDFYIYFICLFTKIAHLNGYSTLAIFSSKRFFGFRSNISCFFTLAIFSKQFLYFICLLMFTKIAHLNGYSTDLKASNFFLASENSWKITNVNSTT